jgi:hypothetical protein
MTYTLAHLKIAHHIGNQNVSFEETVETIALLERNGVIDGQGQWVVGNGAKQRGTRDALPAKESSPVRRKRRGGLSKKIVTFLQTKGPKGAHVKDIAAAVKTKPGNVTSWFYGTGKSHVASGHIKKTAPATFAYLKK